MRRPALVRVRLLVLASMTDSLPERALNNSNCSPGFPAMAILASHAMQPTVR
jgi:hypothetical protein